MKDQKPLAFLLGICLLFLFGCSRAQEPTPPPPTPTSPSASTTSSASSTGASAETSDSTIKIVAMGDSLTEGLGVDPELAYPAQLEERLHASGHNAVVVNAGISGETSSGALSRVEWVLKNQQPDIVILETGANDGLRGIDLTLTAENLDTLVATLKDNDVTVVLAGMQIVQNMGSEYVEEFRTIFPQIAEKHDVILIPFFLEDVAAVRELNQADEIHPTAEGYTIVVENVYSYVVEALNTITQ